jgi:hypothetical protein
MQIWPGAMVFSQNLLSTLISSIGYQYANGHHVIVPSVSWRGWYPVIEFSAQLGGETHFLPSTESTETLSGKSYFEYQLSSYVPLVYYRGKNITLLLPRIEYEFTKSYYFSADSWKSGIDHLHYKFYFNHYRRLSYRDLHPRWGQYFSISYTQTPTDRDQFGSFVSAEAGGFIPGFAKHHSLHINGGYQKQFAEKYYIPLNRIAVPRGYLSSVSEMFSSLSIDYSFPLIYPDLSLGPVLYVKRIRMDLFHDLSYGENIYDANHGEPYTGTYRSWGTELLADFHFIRIIFPISAGIRIGYRPDNGNTFTELLFNISTSGF